MWQGSAGGEDFIIEKAWFSELDRPRGEYSVLLLIKSVTLSSLGISYFTHLCKGTNNTYFPSLL